ncbi:hypothetical protein GF345_01670 [Candidatus Woesearchaeota archaeon]|nr:hypothetical protein [Candidatus Woesearchaeota archaeon]
MRRIMIAVSLALILVLAACSSLDDTQPDEGVDVVIAPDEGDSMDDDSMQDDAEGMDSEVMPPEDVLSPEEEERMMQVDPGSINEIKCDEQQTLGYIGCTDMDDTAELTIRNTGRAVLGGVYLAYLDNDENLLANEMEKFTFEVGEDKILELSLLDHLEQVNVYPVTNSDVCINKPLVIIPRTNCR